MASSKQTPNKKAYDLQYNRDKRYSITVRLSRKSDAELIEIWENIENKASWFRQALRNTGKAGI